MDIHTNTMKNSKLIKIGIKIKYSDAVFTIGSIVKTGKLSKSNK